MQEEQYIYICFELNAEIIRATKDHWCRPQSVDLVVNSAISEDEIININASLTEPEFLADQERVRIELDNYIKALQKIRPDISKILTAYAPQIYEHNLHELHKWTYSIKKLINASHYKKKVIFPCAYSTNHLYLLEAEGETSATKVRSALYKRTDFLLELLRQFLVSLGIDYAEYGASKTILSSGNYIIRKIGRTFGMAFARGVLHTRNGVRHHLKNTQKYPITQQYELLVILRSVVHAEYFANLLKDKRTMCLVQDGLGVYPKVYRRTKIEGAVQLSHSYDIITPSQIVKLMLQVVGKLCLFTIQSFRDSLLYIFKLDGMSINMITVIQECITASLDTKILSEAISAIASRSDCHLNGVAHSELFTAYPYEIKETCDKFNIRTFQFAFATYEMRPVPDFIYADRFFCFSIHQRKSIVAMGNSFSPVCVCYAGNLLIESSIRKDCEKFEDENLGTKNFILYYSQPFDEPEDEALISVKRTSDAFKMPLYVVMHPRESIQKFKKYGKDLCILTNEEYIKNRSKLLKKTLFAVTRNSNVGYQMLLRNIPLINYLTTAKDLLIKHEYYEGYPLIARSEEKFIEIINSSDDYIEKFKIYRNEYIGRSFLHLGVDEVSLNVFIAQDVNS